MKLAGSVFQNGLCITQFVRALRQSGLRISNDKINAVIDAYMKSTRDEYKEQQARIDEALQLEQNLLVGIDTSFSQCRNAQFSQTACLEDKSKEIVRMVVLDKREQNCVSNKMEALGVQKLFR